VQEDLFRTESEYGLALRLGIGISYHLARLASIYRLHFARCSWCLPISTEKSARWISNLKRTSRFHKVMSPFDPRATISRLRKGDQSARKAPYFMAYFPGGSAPFTLRTQITAAPFSIAEAWLLEGQGGIGFSFISWLR
jgi:hypothetical protein